MGELNLDLEQPNPQCNGKNVATHAPNHTTISRDGLPLCATRRVEPEMLPPEELDAYLEAGWYRIGQNISFCEFVAMDQGTFGVVWTRVPLETYRLRKSLRRIRNKVERDFTVRIHRQVHDMQHELLYQRYLDTTEGSRAPTLSNLAGGFGVNNIFDTWEISIWRGDELVAFSWFDIGAESVESISGVYDPSVASYSMGFYTMIAEIEFARKRGLKYYYAGYVLCGDPCMDYKLRTGHIEVLDRIEGCWRPIEDDEHADLARLDPLERTRLALEDVRYALDLPEAMLYHNPHFSLCAAAPNLTSCLSYHLVLFCGPSRSGIVHVVAWDSVAHQYELLRCVKASLTSPETGEVFLNNLLVTSKSLGRWDSIEDMARVNQIIFYG